MPDPFRPNSNAQLIREAQFAFFVIAALLCVLAYVGFQKFNGRKIYFQEIAQTAPVAKHIDGTQYTAQAMLDNEANQVQTFIDRVQQIAVPKTTTPATPPPQQDTAVAKANFLTPLSGADNPPPVDHRGGREFHSTSTHQTNDDPFAKIQSDPDFSAALFTPSKNLSSRPGSSPALPPMGEPSKSDFIPASKPLPEIQSNFGNSRSPTAPVVDFEIATSSNVAPPGPGPTKIKKLPKTITPHVIPARPITPRPSTTQPPAVDLALADPPSPDPKSFNPTANRQSLTGSAISAKQPTPSTPSTQSGKLKSFLDPRPDEPDNQRAAKIERDFTPPIDVAKVPAAESSTAKKSFPRPSSGTTYQTIAQDSLWSIAVNHYGDGRFFRALYRHNRQQIPDAQHLKSGIVLNIPHVDQLIQQYSELCPADQVRQARAGGSGDPTSQNQYANYEAKMEVRYHVTGPSDTLFGIARQRLGQASRYLEIFELNRFRIPANVNHLTPLKPGLRLLLPE